MRPLALPSPACYLAVPMNSAPHTPPSRLAPLELFLEDLRLRRRPLPPLVVFDCDGTLIRGDIGEAMFYRQIEHFLFRVSPALLWHDHPGREQLANLYESLAPLPPARRTADRRFGAFADLLLSRYFDQLAAGRTAQACADIVRLFAGFRRREVMNIAASTLRGELAAPEGTRTLGHFRLPTGIRYIRESGGWLARLIALAADVWVISGSSQWSVETVLAGRGVPAERILGIDLQEDGGVLTPNVRGHVPVLEGKVLALGACTPRRPDLVVSDSIYDLPLFDHAAGLRVLVRSRNGTSADFFAAAGVSGDDRWAVLENPTIEEGR